MIGHRSSFSSSSSSAAGPVARMQIAQVAANVNAQPARLGQRPGRLQRPLQRAAVDSRQLDVGQPPGKGSGLSASLVVQVDAGPPARHPVCRHIIGEAVADQ